MRESIRLRTISLAIFGVVTAGCVAVEPARVAPAEVPFPVLVGPVSRVGDDNGPNARSTKSLVFEARSIHHRIPQWGQFHFRTTQENTPENAFGSKLLESRPKDASFRVAQFEVGAKLTSWWLFGAIYGGHMKADNWVGINGAYEEL
jgi:hypothetical protein